MGKPSDKRRAARRPGRRERARVKKHVRGNCSAFVGGAYTFTVLAGRTKFAKVYRYVDSLVERAHLGGEPLTLKSKGGARRPLYTASSRLLPLPPSNVKVTGAPSAED